MKIIVLSSCYPNRANINSGIFVHQQVLALKALGADCHVIQPVNWYPPLGLHRLHPYWQGGYEIDSILLDQVDGIPIHHPKVFVRMPSRLFSTHSWDLQGQAVARYINRHKVLRDADVIYAQFLVHEGYVGTVVKALTGIPLVSIALGDDVHAWPEKNASIIPFLRKALYASDLLLANSNALARDTERWAEPGRPVACVSAYQGVDLDKFSPVESVEQQLAERKQFSLSPDLKYLLCVATPVRLKGWMELLDAIEKLGTTFDGWRLLIVAPKRKYTDAIDLLKEAGRRSISDRVQHLQSVAHGDMPNLMRAVDAFVLPSYNEGLSNAVIEAMASGLAVVATDVGGHGEFIDHYSNGLLVPPGDVDALANALKTILNKPAREKLSLASRTGAEKIGSFSSNAKKLLRLFERIVEMV